MMQKLKDLFFSCGNIFTYPTAYIYPRALAMCVENTPEACLHHFADPTLGYYISGAKTLFYYHHIDKIDRMQHDRVSHTVHAVYYHYERDSIYVFTLYEYITKFSGEPAPKLKDFGFKEYGLEEFLRSIDPKFGGTNFQIAWHHRHSNSESSNIEILHMKFAKKLLEVTTENEEIEL